ncbi:RidA family protein [Rhodococcus sp. NPDC057529]|uniref:RidA family protein n=1 Tax=Rhodococcus sp. NPDC057529 TaxID=3346158 RepID=UPI00366B4533
MSGRRAVHVEGLEHGTNPIPAASRRGPMLFTSNVFGRDRTDGSTPESVSDEIARTFDNLQTILRAGGSDLGAVLKIEVTLSSPNYRAELNEHWERQFPDASDRPARHVAVGDLPAGFRVQFAAVAYDG